MFSTVTCSNGARAGPSQLDPLLSLLTGDEKHDAASRSTLDALWVLYDRVLRIDPARPDDPARDRFFLSKGHGPAAYYAVLAAKGFIEQASLSRFGRFDSILGNHPDRNLVPGVEISSGSLGHGLGIAVGSALALRAYGRDEPRVFCLLGDGELAEGSNHEAIAFAGRMRLGRLTVVVIDNGSASYGWPGGIERRFTVEGWEGRSVPSADHDAVESALRGVGSAPRVVVARTGRA